MCPVARQVRHGAWCTFQQTGSRVTGLFLCWQFTSTGPSAFSSAHLSSNSNIKGSPHFSTGKVPGEISKAALMPVSRNLSQAGSIQRCPIPVWVHMVCFRTIGDILTTCKFLLAGLAEKQKGWFRCWLQPTTWQHMCDVSNVLMHVCGWPQSLAELFSFS